VQSSKPSVRDQPLAHVDHIECFVAESTTELDRFQVVESDLQVDLRTTKLEQASLGLRYQPQPDPRLPVGRKYPDIVDRTPVTVVSGMSSASNLRLQTSNRPALTKTDSAWTVTHGFIRFVLVPPQSTAAVLLGAFMDVE
jgi:hypothetical protein